MGSGATPARGASPGRRKDWEEVKAPFRAFLKEKRLHGSKVRDLVVDTFLDAENHLGLEAILERARRRDPSVSFTTVYRTMRLLVEAGLVQERDFGSGSALYELSHGRQHHDHLICERCGLVEEFVNEKIEELQERVASKHGFELRRHRHDLFGLCSRCQARER